MEVEITMTYDAHTFVLYNSYLALGTDETGLNFDTCDRNVNELRRHHKSNIHILNEFILIYSI